MLCDRNVDHELYYGSGFNIGSILPPSAIFRFSGAGGDVEDVDI